MIVASRKRLLLIGLGILSSTMVRPGEAKDRPSLYGKVLLATSSGTIVLSDAVVTLFTSDSRTSRKTYTDSRGSFAFYRTPKGKYKIEISLGGKVLQQQGAGTTSDRRELEFSGEGTRIPDITVQVGP